jgi:hypothetical protein
MTTENSDEVEPDPGLMALYFLFSILGLLWFGPYAWDLLIMGDPSAVRRMSDMWQTGLFEFLEGIAAGFADPNDAGFAAFTFNWIYTLMLFVTLMALIAFPSLFRKRVNEFFIGGTDD